jgi:hypothetical protein
MYLISSMTFIFFNDYIIFSKSFTIQNFDDFRNCFEQIQGLTNKQIYLLGQ